MPKPIDRGGGGFLFDRKAVLAALGIISPAEPIKEPQANWDFDPDAYRATHARTLRRRKGAGWRDRHK